MVTDARLLQFRKASFPIDVTPFPMVTDARLVQPWNALPPIDVTLLGMVTDARLLQYAKALPPIDVTPFPMVTDARLLQFRKASFPIDVTPSPIKTILKDFNPEHHLSISIGHKKDTDSRLFQFSNAESDILSTNIGNVMVLRLLQPEKE